MPVELVSVETDEDTALARELIDEYAYSLDIDLAFQDFHRELDGLPGRYAPPLGSIILAWDSGRLAGCVALGPFSEGVCEMKRLYVRPGFRGRGIGRMLAGEAISEARSIGYERIVLDTLASMTEARNLYRSLGFGDIPPYRFNPVEGAVFMELRLS